MGIKALPPLPLNTPQMGTVGMESASSLFLEEALLLQLDVN